MITQINNCGSFFITLIIINLYHNLLSQAILLHAYTLPSEVQEKLEKLACYLIHKLLKQQLPGEHKRRSHGSRALIVPWYTWLYYYVITKHLVHKAVATNPNHPNNITTNQVVISRNQENLYLKNVFNV